MFFASGGSPTFGACASAGAAATKITEAKVNLRIIEFLPAAGSVVARPAFGRSVTPSIVARHSGARAKPASPESITTTLEYGFRARPTDLGFTLLSHLVAALWRCGYCIEEIHALGIGRDRWTFKALVRVNLVFVGISTSLRVLWSIRCANGSWKTIAWG